MWFLGLRQPTKRLLRSLFDDGPDPITPTAFLDILIDETVPATFYVLGSNVNQFPDIARAPCG